MSRQALTGIKVLEVSGGVAAGFAGRLLAGFGAQVDVVEPPEGSPLRRLPPHIKAQADEESSAVFLYLAANKRHLTLDVKTETGRRLFSRLVAGADIILDDGHLRDASISYDSVAQANERAVIVAISPLGLNGSYADYQATEIVIQALGGSLFCSGYKEYPLYMPGDAAQYVGGVYAAIGSLAALRARSATGKGQIIDMALARAVIEWPFTAMTTYEYTGADGVRATPVRDWQGVQRTRDGYIGVNILTEQQWQDLVRYMGLHELLADGRFDTPLKRIANREALADILAPWWAEHETMGIFESGMEWRIAFGLPLTFEQIANWEHYIERGFVVQQCLPDGREIKTLSRPFTLTAGGWQDRWLTTKMGAGNVDVSAELANGGEDVDELLSGGAI